MVVGAGNSAVQIARELAEVAETTLATRAPIRFIPQVVLGRDLHFWLSVSGLDRLPLGRLFDVSEPGRRGTTGRRRGALRKTRPAACSPASPKAAWFGTTGARSRWTPSSSPPATARTWAI